MSVSIERGAAPASTREAASAPSLGHGAEIGTGAEAVAARRRRHVVKVVAAIAVLSFGVRLDLPVGVSVQFVIAALLMPVWLPLLRRYVGARLLLGVGALAVVAGLWLATLHSADHVVSSTETSTEVVLLIGVLVTIGLLVWARTILGLWLTALLFGVGMLVAVYPVSVDFATNPWKFGFEVPVAVILLSLTRRWNRWYLDAAVVAGLALYCVSHDARSAFGEFFLVLVLLLVQVPLKRLRRPGSIARVIVAIGVLAVVVFEAGQALILNGFLGAATQERSVAQLQASGSLITGGRPELAATAALFSRWPAGFGAGVSVDPVELQAAKSGMSAIGYKPDNGYVNVYMFGGHVELHSVTGDIWARFGFVGLAFVLVLIVVLVGGAASSFAHRRATGLTLFAVVVTLWNLVFSPFLSSASILELAVVAVLIPVVDRARRTENAPIDFRAEAEREPAWPTPTAPVARPNTVADEG